MNTDNVTMKSMEISMSDIWYKIEDIRWRIQDQLQNHWTDYGMHTDGLYSYLYGMFDTVYKGIIEKLTTTKDDIETWIDETKTKIYDLSEYVKRTVKTAIDEISKDLTSFWDDVILKFKNLKTEISAWIAGVVEDIKDLSLLLVEKVKDILMALTEFATSIIGKIEDRFWNTLQYIKDWSLQIIRNIVDRATEIKDLVVEKIKETIKEVKDTGLRVIAKTKEVIDDLKDKLVQAWEKFGTVIIDTMTDFKNYLTDLFTLDTEEVVNIMKMLLNAQINAEKEIIGAFKGKT